MKKNFFYKNFYRTVQISLCLAFFLSFFSCKTIKENTAEEDKIHSAVTENTESSEKNTPYGKPEKIQPEKIDTSEEPENSVKEFIVQDEPSVKAPLYEKEKTEEKEDGKADGNSKNKDSVKENKEPLKSTEKEEKPKDSPRTKSAEEDKKTAKDEQDKKDKDREPKTEEKSGGKEAEKRSEEDSLKEPAVKSGQETEAAKQETEKEENSEKNKAEDESFILNGEEDISDEDIFGNFENAEDFDIESLIDESVNEDYANRSGDKEMKTETVPSKDFFYETPPPAEEPEEEPKSKISRSVSVGKGQRLELSYPAEGWVYLGEATGQKGLKYLHRKLQKGNSVFTFNAEKDGDYILNFSFFDVFSDEHILDSVAVTVTSDKKTPAEKITAPPYKREGKKNKGKGESKDGAQNTDIQKLDIPSVQKEPSQKTETKPKTEEDIFPSAEPINKNASAGQGSNSPVFDEPDVFANTAETNSRISKQPETGKDGKTLIEKAEKEIAAGNAEDALKTLEEFFAFSASHLDEGWFLKAKAYEINGKLKNMKAALEAYKFIVKAFPESRLWEKADARIRYIEKFYINIR